MTQRLPAPANPTSAFVDEYWSNLSDVQLLAIPWYIDDPRTLANIQPVIPPDLGEFQIEVEYERDHADQAVPCAHCPQHTPHWHGFVLLAADGRRFLLGSVCGPKAYGTHYRIASNARREAKSRYEALVKWQRWTEQLPDLIEALVEAETAPAFKAVRRVRAHFENQASGLLNRLRRIPPHSLTGKRELEISTVRRDEEAEATRSAQFLVEIESIAHLTSKPHRIAMQRLREIWKPNEPIYLRDERNLGPLPPLEWLLAVANPTKIIPDVTTRLRGYLAVGRKTQSQTTTKLNQLSRAADQDVAQALTAMKDIRTAGEFFQSEILQAVAEWDRAQSTTSFSVTAIGQQLQIAASGGKVVLGLGSAWAPPGDLFCELAALRQ